MTFIAKYDGICEDCDAPFKAGQEIDRTGAGDYVHVQCPDDLKPVGSVCPKCFVELPVSGACGTCD